MKFMETFIPDQTAGIDCIMAYESLRKEELCGEESPIALPLQKMFDTIVSFISSTDFE